MNPTTSEFWQEATPPQSGVYWQPHITSESIFVLMEETSPLPWHRTAVGGSGLTPPTN